MLALLAAAYYEASLLQHENKINTAVYIIHMHTVGVYMYLAAYIAFPIHMHNIGYTSMWILGKLISIVGN